MRRGPTVIDTLTFLVILFPLLLSRVPSPRGFTPSLRVVSLTRGVRTITRTSPEKDEYPLFLSLQRQTSVSCIITLVSRKDYPGYTTSLIHKKSDGIRI